jgi:hypothetical protein
MSRRKSKKPPLVATPAPVSAIVEQIAAPLYKGTEIAPHYGARLVVPRAANFDPLSSAWVQAYTAIPNDIHLGTGIFTYSMLRMMSRVPWVAMILLTRMNQAAEYAAPLESDYSLGYTFIPDSPGALSRKDKQNIGEMQELFDTSGAEFFPGGFEAFMRAVVYNTYTFDQVNAEKLMNAKTGKPWAFIPVDPTTVRRKAPSMEETKDLRWDYSKSGFVQFINNRIVNEYTPDQMAFWIRNREDNIYRLGYGAPELEKSATIVYALVTAIVHNIVNYTTGVHSQNIVEAGLVGGDQRLDTFERTLAAATSGIRNSRRTPVVQTNPALEEYLKVHQLTHPNKEMEFSEWINILKKDLYALFQMDPAENGNIFGNEGQKQQMNQTSPSERISASKERGLRPLMRIIQRWLNEWLIKPYWPGYRLIFRGFDTLTEEKKLELDLKAVTAYTSPDEIRIARGLVPWGDPVSSRPLNALYSAYAQAEMDKQNMGGMPDEADGVVGF